MRNQPLEAWKQLSLVPPPVVTVTLRVGVWTSTGDLHLQLEAQDETGDELLAMIAWPSRPSCDAATALEIAIDNLRALVEDYRGPFPG
jgi:hypothetical protein